MCNDVWDRIRATGNAAVLAGQHRSEISPRKSGRWGPSVILFPSSELAKTLDALTAEAMNIVGGGEHWWSGSRDLAHVTVRSLDLYSEKPPDRNVSGRWLAALERTVANSQPFPLHFAGLALSPGGLLVRVDDPTGGADELRERLAIQLGTDGWLEETFYPDGRDPIWYCTLIHFVGPLIFARRLVDWVTERAEHWIGTDLFTTVSLSEWSFDGHGMRPTILSSRTIPYSATGRT